MELRQELLAWEKSFYHEHGRRPSSQDVRDNAKICAKYAEYKRYKQKHHNHTGNERGTEGRAVDCGRFGGECDTDSRPREERRQAEVHRIGGSTRTQSKEEKENVRLNRSCESVSPGHPSSLVHALATLETVTQEEKSGLADQWPRRVTQEELRPTPHGKKNESTRAKHVHATSQTKSHETRRDHTATSSSICNESKQQRCSSALNVPAQDAGQRALCVDPKPTKKRRRPLGFSPTLSMNKFRAGGTWPRKNACDAETKRLLSGSEALGVRRTKHEESLLQLGEIKTLTLAKEQVSTAKSNDVAKQNKKARAKPLFALRHRPKQGDDEYRQRLKRVLETNNLTFRAADEEPPLSMASAHCSEDTSLQSADKVGHVCQEHDVTRNLYASDELKEQGEGTHMQGSEGDEATALSINVRAAQDERLLAFPGKQVPLSDTEAVQRLREDNSSSSSSPGTTTTTASTTTATPSSTMASAPASASFVARPRDNGALPSLLNTASVPSRPSDECSRHQSSVVGASPSCETVSSKVSPNPPSYQAAPGVQSKRRKQGTISDNFVRMNLKRRWKPKGRKGGVGGEAWKKRTLAQLRAQRSKMSDQVFAKDTQGSSLDRGGWGQEDEGDSQTISLDALLANRSSSQRGRVDNGGDVLADCVEFLEEQKAKERVEFASIDREEQADSDPYPPVKRDDSECLLAKDMGESDKEQLEVGKDHVSRRGSERSQSFDPLYQHQIIPERTSNTNTKDKHSGQSCTSDLAGDEDMAEEDDELLEGPYLSSSWSSSASDSDSDFNDDIEIVYEGCVARKNDVLLSKCNQSRGSKDGHLGLNHEKKCEDTQELLHSGGSELSAIQSKTASGREGVSSSEQCSSRPPVQRLIDTTTLNTAVRRDTAFSATMGDAGTLALTTRAREDEKATAGTPGEVAGPAGRRGRKGRRELDSQVATNAEIDSEGRQGSARAVQSPDNMDLASPRPLPPASAVRRPRAKGEAAQDPVCSGHLVPAKEFTVRKSGPNKGRKFFACAFPRGERCDFFLWSEQHASRAMSMMKKKINALDWAQLQSQRYAEALGRLSVAELREEARRSGDRVTGRKAELVDRLRQRRIRTICRFHDLPRLYHWLFAPQSQDLEQEEGRHADGDVERDCEHANDKDEASEGAPEDERMDVPLKCSDCAKPAKARPGQGSLSAVEDSGRCMPQRRRLRRTRARGQTEGSESPDSIPQALESTNLGKENVACQTGTEASPGVPVSIDAGAGGSVSSTESVLSESMNAVLENIVSSTKSEVAELSPALRSVAIPGTSSLRVSEHLAVRTALRRVFGLSSLRPGQEWCIGRVLRRQSSLLILPTGGGKSLCYQLPALLLPLFPPPAPAPTASGGRMDSSLTMSRGTAASAPLGAATPASSPPLAGCSWLEPLLTIVVSPLLALMQDQIERLPPHLPAATLSGQQSAAETAQVLRGLAERRIRVLFLSPEKLTSPSFLRLARSPGCLPRVGLVCVDEAHCLSEWSHNFRPSFLQLPHTLAHVLRPDCVLALTASASPPVVRDVCHKLGVPRGPGNGGGVWVGHAARPNLSLRLRHLSDPGLKHKALLDLLRGAQEAIGVTRRPARGGATPPTDASTIVYVSRQWEAEALSSFLAAEGLSAVPFHAGLPRDVRAKNQSLFMRGRVRVVVATVAFGMGLDKRDVRCVVHFAMPRSLENYLQEVGRAGRDGAPAHCLLFLADEDMRALHSLTHSHGAERANVAVLAQAMFATEEAKVRYKQGMRRSIHPRTSFAELRTAGERGVQSQASQVCTDTKHQEEEERGVRAQAPQACTYNKKQELEERGRKKQGRSLDEGDEEEGKGSEKRYQPMQPGREDETKGTEEWGGHETAEAVSHVAARNRHASGTQNSQRLLNAAKTSDPSVSHRGTSETCTYGAFSTPDAGDQGFQVAVNLSEMEKTSDLKAEVIQTLVYFTQKAIEEINEENAQGDYCHQQMECCCFSDNNHATVSFRGTKIDKQGQSMEERASTPFPAMRMHEEVQPRAPGSQCSEAEPFSPITFVNLSSIYKTCVVRFGKKKLEHLSRTEPIVASILKVGTEESGVPGARGAWGGGGGRGGGAMSMDGSGVGSNLCKSQFNQEIRLLNHDGKRFLSGDQHGQGESGGTQSLKADFGYSLTRTFCCDLLRLAAAFNGLRMGGNRNGSNGSSSSSSSSSINDSSCCTCGTGSSRPDRSNDCSCSRSGRSCESSVRSSQGDSVARGGGRGAGRGQAEDEDKLDVYSVLCELRRLQGAGGLTFELKHKALRFYLSRDLSFGEICRVVDKVHEKARQVEKEESEKVAKAFATFKLAAEAQRGGGAGSATAARDLEHDQCKRKLGNKNVDEYTKTQSNLARGPSLAKHSLEGSESEARSDSSVSPLYPSSNQNSIENLLDEYFGYESSRLFGAEGEKPTAPSAERWREVSLPFVPILGTDNTVIQRQEAALGPPKHTKGRETCAHDSRETKSAAGTQRASESGGHVGESLASKNSLRRLGRHFRREYIESDVRVLLSDEIFERSRVQIPYCSPLDSGIASENHTLRVSTGRSKQVESHPDRFGSCGSTSTGSEGGKGCRDYTTLSQPQSRANTRTDIQPIIFSADCRGSDERARGTASVSAIEDRTKANVRGRYQVQDPSYLSTGGLLVTPRVLARIFHGLQSPQYPSTVLKSSAFWRRYADCDFQVLQEIVEDVMRKHAR